MQKNIIKYYKRTVRSLFVSKYNYSNFMSIIDCKSISYLVLKKSKLKILHLVCGFFSYYIGGVLPKIYYKNLLRSKKKNKKYRFLGCTQSFANSNKYFLFFNLFRRLNIYSFLGSYNLKKKFSGVNLYRLLILNTSYILKKPALKWEFFMFFDLFFTNNLKVVYSIVFTSTMLPRER